MLPACSAAGKQVVFFNTGFSIEVDSYTRQDQTLVFCMGDGTLAFPANQVSHIDPLPDRPSSASAAVLAAYAEEPETILNEEAYRQGLDEDFVRSVAKVESGLQQTAVSTKGAVGLMQLMPSTAAELGVDPTRAPENAQGGAMYLRALLVRYHGNSALALAAYNAGPGAVAKFGGVPPYEETRRYITLVLREYGRRVQAKKLSPSAHLATSRTSASPSRPTSTN